MPLVYKPIPLKSLIKKYQANIPRYTSYPTPDHWNNKPAPQGIAEKLSKLRAAKAPISLYVHIPFCHKLCHYCACNVLIRSRKHAQADTYLNNLDNELATIKHLAGGRLKVNQLHWGGGTPTFLDEGQLARLMRSCKEHFEFSQLTESSVETEPSSTSLEQITALLELGFKRISFGVQDFDNDVLEQINRYNSPDRVRRLVKFCQDIGYRSVNLDFIYGLPCQTVSSFLKTIDLITEIHPDRLAMYSFAHLPEQRKHHRLIRKDLLPSPQTKANIFLRASEKLADSGYQPVGMDHFALAGDELSYAMRNNCLTRNFMGYTVCKAEHVLGTGLTAISFLDGQYFQNTTDIREYKSSLSAGELPLIRSCTLTHEDYLRKGLIDDLMCNLRIDIQQFEKKQYLTLEDCCPGIIQHLDKCEADGLLNITDGGYKVTELGRLFLRSIAQGFDAYLHSSSKGIKPFSKVF